MEWTEAIDMAIKYIEEHITEDITAEDIAGQVHISPFYFQKGFSLLCGCSISEYIRNRRLTLAAGELVAENVRVIDVAVKYCYDSPDSFTKAFYRFHGATPSMVQKEHSLMRSFAPLKIKLTLEGGYKMDYKLMKKESFTVMGAMQKFSYEEASTAIPAFWQEHSEKGRHQYVDGMFGINIDESKGFHEFEYLIADLYNPTRDVPEGFTTVTIPALTWAVFSCTGALPNSMTGINTRIFSEWLPALKEYEFAAGYCIEMYDNPQKYANGINDENYYSEIWIPVKKK
ncbi:MAG: AraC family transcriptional regulator [Lachnospiraceae bacterium]|nr:AraC family transcriptional regulator [Lachnospiraceae bacterium]